MRHTTYILQNTHAIETKPHTHTHATVRSIFSQIDLQRNHSHAPHDLQTAKYTRNRNKATHTHTCHRQVNLQLNRSSTHSHDTTYRKFSPLSTSLVMFRCPFTIKCRPPSPRSIVGFPIPTIVNVWPAGTVIVDDNLQSSVNS